MNSEILERAWDGVRVLTLSVVNLDAAATQRLEAELLGTADDDRGMVLDVGAVEFADSPGLGILARLASLKGERFALGGVGKRLSLCLQRLPEERSPRAFDSVDAAVAFLAERNPVSMHGGHE